VHFWIEGGFPLQGNVKCQGAKNSAVQLLAASLLTREPVILENIPAIVDIVSMIDLLRSLGSQVEFDQNKHRVCIENTGPIDPHIQNPQASALRASLSLVGPLLARERETSIPFPGGCNIGSRPIDLHLKGFGILGADALLEHGRIIAKARILLGKRIYLDYPSVGATANLMMAGSLARGETILENAAEEPEIVDLANMLKKMGAKIRGAGTKMLQIRGVQSLKGVRHHLIPDRIEGGTYLVAAAITRGKLSLQDAIPQHLEPLLVKLQEAGAAIEVTRSRVQVFVPGRLRAFDIKTMPYPGFPTDLQNQMTALMTLAEGTSLVTETVFENRFLLTSELRKMGADIRIEGHGAAITGVDHLTGAQVTAPNLRGGASLVLAALSAQGISEVHDILHIDRGYEKMEEKLQQVGAKIQRIESKGSRDAHP
jgi:UDP-N-acetylglucosamine 1-carboxyvinyltransferase